MQRQIHPNYSNYLKYPLGNVISTDEDIGYP